MISLNLSTPHREVRSASPGHDAVIEAVLGGGGYGGLSVPGVLASCTARLAGVLASADTDPSLVGILPAIARQIVWTGEVVLFLNPNLKLEIVTSYDVVGTASSRVYSIEIAGPSRSLTYKNIGQDQICHAIVRPSSMAPWRGEGWKQSAGIVADQIAAVDQAIKEEAGQPRGSLLPTVAAESPERVKKLLASLLRLRGGLSSYPLLGRQGEGAGPNPAAIRLQTCSLPELLRAREDLSAALAESLGFSRVTLGIGVSGQVSRPDGLRSWIVSTASAWAGILQSELERVLERPVVLDLEPILAGLVPLGLRVGGAARLVAQGWTKMEAETIMRLSP